LNWPIELIKAESTTDSQSYKPHPPKQRCHYPHRRKVQPYDFSAGQNRMDVIKMSAILEREDIAEVGAINKY